MQYNANIRFFGMVGPLSRAFGISEVATVTLEANNIDDFTSPPFSQTLTPTTAGILAFLDNDGVSGYRYWKLSIDDSTNPNIIEIGYFYLGDYVQLQDRTVNKGFGAGVNDGTKIIESINGTVYFDERQKYHEFNGLSLGYLSDGDRKIIENMYYRIGKANPIFVSLDPKMCLSNVVGELTKLMIFEREPIVTHNFNDKYSVSFSLREVV